MYAVKFGYRQLHRSVTKMKWIRVYNGTGMYEEDTAILMRVLRQHVDETIYNVGTITPDEIVNGNSLKSVLIDACK